MFSQNPDMFSSFYQEPDLNYHANTPPNRRSNSGSLNTHFRNSPPSKNKNRIKNNIDQVGYHQDSHSYGSITRSTENGIDHKQQHDHHIASQHPSSIFIPFFQCPFIGTHQRQQLTGVKNAGNGKRNRSQDRQPNRLDSGQTGFAGVLFSNTSCYNGRHSHRQANTNRIQQI